MKRQYQDNISSRIMAPIQRFMNQEKAGVMVLGIAVVVSVVMANTPWSDDYHHFFEQKFGLVFNGSEYLYYSLHHWINDGLMSMFFFVVGLELKREFIGGELADIRNTILPVGAAVAGMLAPAAIYLLFNIGTGASGGWGIPMATDIAFSLAILSLLGNRVPLPVKVFLTTLAIVDDLGAVIVIALFYTSEISLVSIAVGVAFLLVMFVANKIGVKNVVFYGVIGIGGVWTAFLMSGVHATIAAVLAAFMIPADSRIPEAAYIARANRLLRRFRKVRPNEVSTLEHEQVDIIDRVIDSSKDAIPPLQRLELAMHPLVSFVIMPVFALANAGVSFGGLSLSSAFSTGIAGGVLSGLLIGKPAGILFSVILLTRLRLARLPEGMTLRHVAGIGFLASVGFTMSVFISTLAFTEDTYLVQAKLGIFAASIAGGFIGYRLLKQP